MTRDKAPARPAGTTRARSPGRTQRGAALLTAMLTVTLVATFAAAAVWQQWRSSEVEAAERARSQAGWVLIGALDWSRLILREDGRAGGADYLSEPWAVPLAEAKLTTFLAADKNISSDQLEGLPEAYLSGRIVDAQSKLNVLNLVDGGKPVTAAVAAFNKLFQLLNLPAGELNLMVTSLQQALPPNGTVPNAAGPLTPNAATAAAAAAAGTATTTTSTTTAGTIGTTTTSPTTTTSTNATMSTGPLMPQRESQLGWLGLSPSTVAALEPYVTVLPVRTPLNINTASPEAIFASVAQLDMAGAKRLAAARATGYFKTLADANGLIQQSGAQLVPAFHSVATAYFEVQARLRIDNAWVEEQTLLQRNGIDVRMVWRERGAGATLDASKP